MDEPAGGRRDRAPASASHRRGHRLTTSCGSALADHGRRLPPPHPELFNTKAAKRAKNVKHAQGRHLTASFFCPRFFCQPGIHGPAAKASLEKIEGKDGRAGSGS